MKRILLVAALCFAGAADAASYSPPAETATLKPSAHPGYAVAQDHCLACHSADYVRMQPPGKPKLFWETEVAKMILVYKAAIAEDDAKAISSYLAETY
jgi:mono/diheme cytochrome c family protein